MEGGTVVNPFACTWAVVHFSLAEHFIFESRFKRNIKLMVRLVDDMLMIGEKVSNEIDDWKYFKSHAIQASYLSLVCEDLCEEAFFLMQRFGLIIKITKLRVSRTQKGILVFMFASMFSTSKGIL